jgi:hypothetical protein
MKAPIKKTLASFDYTIRRLPERDDSNHPAPTDDLVSGTWFSHVLQRVDISGLTSIACPNQTSVWL